MTERRKDNKNRVLKDREYQRSNGTYEYKWCDRSGKRHSIYAKTLEELREKELDVLKDIMDGIKVSHKNLTVTDMYERWVKLKKGIADTTFQNYKFHYNQYVREGFGKRRITDVKRSDVRAFYNTLYDEKHYSVSTIDSVHTVLHQVFEMAVEDEYIRNNPTDNALKELKKAHNGDVEKRKALTYEEQMLLESFLKKNAKYHRWYPVFTIMVNTGMRVGEICGLRWEDIDLDNDTITVDHTLVYFDRGGSERCGFAVHKTKTKAGTRIIPMLPKVKQAFLEEKKYQEEVGLKSKASIDGYRDFIFINRFGNTQHQGTLNKALKRIIRDCNYNVLEKNEIDDAVVLPPFSCHSLRHTFATRMCEADVNLKVIQDTLGHKDIETTMDIYTDATKKMKDKGMKTLEQFFEELDVNA